MLADWLETVVQGRSPAYLGKADLQALVGIGLDMLKVYQPGF